MRTRLRLTFNAENRPWPRVRTILRDAGQAKVADEGPAPLGLYTAVFWEGQPEVGRLRAALQEEGIEPLEARERVFTERERREAPLLRIIIRRTPKGYGGLTMYGNESRVFGWMRYARAEAGSAFAGATCGPHSRCHG